MRSLSFAHRRVLPVLLLLLAGLLCAQKQPREPLTEKQIDQIAEAGVDPNQRITLYVKFLNEHMETLAGLTKRASNNARNRKIAGELQDLAALFDELDANLDTYAERKADIRKSLQALNDAVSHWQQALRALLADPLFELERKEAIESAQDLGDDAARLQTEQKAYFSLHKDETGQDRWEPH